MTDGERRLESMILDLKGDITRRLDEMERQRIDARGENRDDMRGVREDIKEIKDVQAGQATAIADLTKNRVVVDGAWAAFKNLVTYVGPLATLAILLWKG